MNPDYLGMKERVRSGQRQTRPLTGNRGKQTHKRKNKPTAIWIIEEIEKDWGFCNIQKHSRDFAKFDPVDADLQQSDRNLGRPGIQFSEPGKNKPTARLEASPIDAQQTHPPERSPVPNRPRSSRILIETKQSQHHAQASRVRQGRPPDRDTSPVFDIFVARKTRQTGFLGNGPDFRGWGRRREAEVVSPDFLMKRGELG